MARTLANHQQVVGAHLRFAYDDVGSAAHRDARLHIADPLTQCGRRLKRDSLGLGALSLGDGDAE